MLIKDIFSCVQVSFYFFTAAHFHLAGRSLLAASISHFLTLGTRGFPRVRWKFSVLAEGRHIFGGHYKDLIETGNRARKVSGTRVSFSQRRYEIFMFFFQRNSSPSFSITRSSSFSVIYVSVNIKNNVEKDPNLFFFVVVFFSLSLSKSPGGHTISFQIKP